MVFYLFYSYFIEVSTFLLKIINLRSIPIFLSLYSELIHKKINQEHFVIDSIYAFILNASTFLDSTSELLSGFYCSQQKIGAFALLFHSNFLLSSENIRRRGRYDTNRMKSYYRDKKEIFGISDRIDRSVSIWAKLHLAKGSSSERR